MNAIMTIVSSNGKRMYRSDGYVWQQGAIYMQWNRIVEALILGATRDKSYNLTKHWRPNEPCTVNIKIQTMKPKQIVGSAANAFVHGNFTLKYNSKKRNKFEISCIKEGISLIIFKVEECFLHLQRFHEHFQQEDKWISKVGKTLLNWTSL